MIIKLINRILKLSGKYCGRIQGAFVLAVIESILSKLPIFYAFIVLSKFYNHSIKEQDCFYIGVALVVTVIVQMFIHNLTDKLQSAAGFMMFADKRLELGDHLRKLPMGYYTVGNIGKVSSVLSTDMVFIEEVSMSTIANMVSYIISSVILIIFMLFLNWRLGAITIVISIMAIILGTKMNGVSIEESKARQTQSEKLTDGVLAFIEGLGIIKSYNLLGEKSKELRNNFFQSKEKALEFEEKMVPWIMGLNLVYALGMSLIFAMAMVLQHKQLLNMSFLLGVLLFLFDIFEPLKALYSESAKLTVMNSCLDRIEEVLNEPELEDHGYNLLPEEDVKEDEVVFENVSFAYEDKNVLNDINLKMKKNTMTALVGPSGGGKTTIANLLARFWDIKKGKIFIRGENIKDISLSTLMDQISVVFQRVYLFQDTIYNNILMAKPNATKEEVYMAAKKAQCYDFIKALPDGFQTIVGEGGAALSGGEKQRISIARCILKDAPIIILDEATASVDSDNESYIQEAISKLVEGKTLLVIAHRLNTINSADQILVISQGEIVERGTHKELMENEKGIYHNFYKIREEKQSWSL